MPRFILLQLALMATLATAHMELLFPPPINSKYDKQTLEANIDYSMTSPLMADGSNYPCKGYNTPEAYSTLKSVATLEAGKDFEIDFAPNGATHEGGSCQFSISYDQGKTFAVIYSVEGGCPLKPSYTVPIPSNLPSAKSATFSWTWFNKVGNREMYQNCAIVDINSSSGATSYTGPQLYRANTYEDGTCTTVEGEDYVFPNPGNSLEYGGSINKNSKVTQLDNCSLKQDGDVTISPSGTSTPSKPSSSSYSAVVPPSSSASKPAATPSPSSVSTDSAPEVTISLQTKRVPFKNRTNAVLPSPSSSSSSPSEPEPTSSSTSSGTNFSPLPSAASQSKSSSSSSSPVWRPVPTVSKTATPSQSSSSTTPLASSSSSSIAAGSVTPTSNQAAVTRPPYVRKTTKAPIRTPVRVTTTLTKTSITTSTSIATSTKIETATVTSSACSTAEATPTGSPFAEESGSSDSGDNSGGTYLKCDTLVTFSLCDSSDSCTFMGSVAPGTQCKDGKIVLATANRLIKVRRGAVVGVPLRGGSLVEGGESGMVRRGLMGHDMRKHS